VADCPSPDAGACVGAFVSSRNSSSSHHLFWLRNRLLDRAKTGAVVGLAVGAFVGIPVGLVVVVGLLVTVGVLVGMKVGSLVGGFVFGAVDDGTPVLSPGVGNGEGFGVLITWVGLKVGTHTLFDPIPPFPPFFPLGDLPSPFMDLPSPFMDFSSHLLPPPFLPFFEAPFLLFEESFPKMFSRKLRSSRSSIRCRRYRLAAAVKRSDRSSSSSLVSRVPSPDLPSLCASSARSRATANTPDLPEAPVFVVVVAIKGFGHGSYCADTNIENRTAKSARHRTAAGRTSSRRCRCRLLDRLMMISVTPGSASRWQSVCWTGDFRLAVSLLLENEMALIKFVSARGVVDGSWGSNLELNGNSTVPTNG
jgi:hypothetical protein